MLIYFAISVTVIISNYIDESNNLDKKDILGLFFFAPPILFLALLDKIIIKRKDI